MSFMTQPWQPLSRNDRHVRRASLRLPTGVSEHRATFLVEEALRLMALPGEDQGRTYFFRRVALRGIAAAAPPVEWVDRAQSTMHALAVRALHGADVRSGDADAVFFYNQEEALEWLLGRLIRSYPGTASTTEWFTPMIASVAPEADGTAQMVAVIERLRSLPSGWFAAATVLLDAVDADSTAVSVVQSIPVRIVRMWLNELGGASARGSDLPRISNGRRRLLLKHLSGHHAASYWGLRRPEVQQLPTRSLRRELSPHLVWLAALAVVAEHPSELAYGLALIDGEAILGELADSIDRASAENRRDALSVPQAEKKYSDVVEDERTAMPEARAMRKSPETDDSDKAKLKTDFDGSFMTAAGGLYFLLNVLRLLSIETAMETLPAPVRSTFVPKLIESLVYAAGVPGNDPALQCVTAAFEVDHGYDSFDAMIAASSCWPRTLLAPYGTEVTPHRLIRVWTVAVRRWCWMHVRLTLHEIVSRSGQILLTRTDLDVTLSMDSVDLRLRRAGLDLDPGWLPWFGRVVRFHYTRENIGGASA